MGFLVIDKCHPETQATSTSRFQVYPHAMHNKRVYAGTPVNNQLKVYICMIFVNKDEDEFIFLSLSNLSERRDH